MAKINQIDYIQEIDLDALTKIVGKTAIECYSDRVKKITTLLNLTPLHCEMQPHQEQSLGKFTIFNKWNMKSAALYLWVDFDKDKNNIEYSLKLYHPAMSEARIQFHLLSEMEDVLLETVAKHFNAICKESITGEVDDPIKH